MSIHTHKYINSNLLVCSKESPKTDWTNINEKTKDAKRENRHGTTPVLSVTWVDKIANIGHNKELQAHSRSVNKRELLIYFQDVAFLPSKRVLPPHFLKMVVVVKALGPPHVLKLWLESSKGKLPVNTLAPTKPHLCQVNVMEMIGLS